MREKAVKQFKSRNEKFSQFLKEGNACWGKAAEEFDKAFTTDHERCEAWKAIRELDPKAQLLFIHLNRKRPGALEPAIKEIVALPAVIQKAIVAMRIVNKPKGGMHPKVKQLIEKGQGAINREMALFQAKIATLMSMRTARTEIEDMER